MKKHVVTVFSVCALISGCVQKPESSKLTAKLFVHNYFFTEKRSNLLEYVSGKAVNKIVNENDYFNKLDKQKNEIEKPSFFLLTDSIPIGLNCTKYTFSIHYEGNITTTQNMFLTLKQDKNVWKVSDYYFGKSGESCSPSLMH